MMSWVQFFVPHTRSVECVKVFKTDLESIIANRFHIKIKSKFTENLHAFRWEPFKRYRVDDP